MRSLARAGIVAGLLAASAPVMGGEIQVTHARCAAEVRVVARDASLSEVLKKLSSVLDFQLRFDSDSDPMVTLDTSERADKLPARLGPSENVSVMLEDDPHCAGQQRIAKVWVLQGVRGPAPRTSLAAIPSAEERRRAKEGAEMVLRAHGMDANGLPAPQ